MIISGVFLHVMADALGSVIVIISAVIMWQTEWKYKYYVDPGLSILLVILILKSVWPLLIESALILLQTVPTHIQVFFNGRECFVNKVARFKQSARQSCS